MKKFSGLVIGILVILVVLQVPAIAGVVSGPVSGSPDPGLDALSASPKSVTAAPTIQPLIKTAQKVLTTTVTPPAGGVLMLGSVPAGASVYVDGSLKGTTPLTVSPITPGVHAVSFKMAGYQDYSSKVTVTAGAIAKLAGTMVPVTPETVTRTIAPPVSGTTPAPVTSSTPVPSRTTVPVTVTRTLTQVSLTPSGTCMRHYSGSGKMGTAPDGRLNCTTIISTSDQIATLSISEGTLVVDAGKKPVPKIDITPVNPGEIPSGAGPDGRRWTGRAYHFLPDGATFDPPVLISFTLSRDEWDRSDPANLTIGETGGNGNVPESLPTTIDPLTRTLSAPARHFSIIGLFSASPEANAPVIQQSPLDLIRTATRSGHGPLPLSPLLPDTYAPLAAVAAGIAISAAAVTTGGSMLVSSWWNRLLSLLQQFLSAESVGLLNATEIEKRGLCPAENLSAVLLGISPREILVIGITAVLFAAAFLLQDRLGLDPVTILIFVCIGSIATILHDLAHKYTAFCTGCSTEYQFWSLGTVTMLFTAWLFGNAFAKPSRTIIRSGKTLLPEEAARIRLAGPLVSIGLAVLSLFLIPLGGLFVVAGSAGFSMNLLNGVFSLVPIRPNDAVEIYAWNKLVWACVFFPLIAFYLYIYTFL